MCFGSGLPVTCTVSVPITSPGMYRESGFTGLSAFILPQKGTAGSARRPKQTTTRVRAAKIPPTPPPVIPPVEPGGTSKSVSLVSGGTLTLSATLDLFSLNAADRKFVFEIIDKLEAYESERKN